MCFYWQSGRRKQDEMFWKWLLTEEYWEFVNYRQICSKGVTEFIEVHAWGKGLFVNYVTYKITTFLYLSCLGIRIFIKKCHLTSDPLPITAWRNLQMIPDLQTNIMCHAHLESCTYEGHNKNKSQFPQFSL